MFGRRSDAAGSGPAGGPVPPPATNGAGAPVNGKPTGPQRASGPQVNGTPKPDLAGPLPFEQIGETVVTMATGGNDAPLSNAVEEIKRRIQPILLKRLDLAVAAELPRDELQRQITDVVSEILLEEKLSINLVEQRALVATMLNDMLGLGPLEPLLADET
ncbi:MAG: hypothetical protein IT563_02005, partial [Alphaproteobacteria bacterium]|nr:hypothetical protein [Alphaproteobacteria bacterium]